MAKLIDNYLDIQLTDNKFTRGHLIKNGNNYESIKPKSDVERNLLATGSDEILFGGCWYKKTKSSSSSMGDSVHTSLKYKFDRIN